MSNEKIISPCPMCQKSIQLPLGRVQDGPTCPQCRVAIFPQTPIDLGDEHFFNFVSRTPLPVLVDVWAPWCGPCRQFAPTLERFAHEMEAKMLVVKVDSDQAPRVAGQLQIRSIPTLIVFRGGVEVARQSGGMSLSGLKEWVKTAGVS